MLELKLFLTIEYTIDPLVFDNLEWYWLPQNEIEAPYGDECIRNVILIEPPTGLSISIIWN